MTLQSEYNPDWKVGSIIRIGDGKDYKITKKVRNVIAYRRYFWWDRLWDRWMDKLGRKD